MKAVVSILVFAAAFMVVLTVSQWVNNTLLTGLWYVDVPLWLAVIGFGFTVGFYSQEFREGLFKRMEKRKEEI